MKIKMQGSASEVVPPAWVRDALLLSLAKVLKAGACSLENPTWKRLSGPLGMPGL